jgi:hypothetical protein
MGNPGTSLHYPIMLRVPWLELHDPWIQWSQHKITFNSPFCLASCQPNQEPTTIMSLMEYSFLEPSTDLEEPKNLKPPKNPKPPRNHGLPKNHKTTDPRQTTDTIEPQNHGQTTEPRSLSHRAKATLLMEPWQGLLHEAEPTTPTEPKSLLHRVKVTPTTEPQRGPSHKAKAHTSIEPPENSEAR